jgi:hypothetical protein
VVALLALKLALLIVRSRYHTLEQGITTNYIYITVVVVARHFVTKSGASGLPLQ